MALKQLKLKATTKVLQHRKYKTIHLFDENGNTYCGHGGGRRDVEINYDRMTLQKAEKDPDAMICRLCRKQRFVKFGNREGLRP